MSIKKERKSLVTTLYESIQRDILSGAYKQYEQIVEQNICDEYSVSRTPVREALRRLESDGLIESIPNRGYYVKGITKDAADDMLILRKILEVQCVRWAIERITEDEMEHLTELYEYMKYYTHKNDIERALTVNSKFHNLIYKASKNEILEKNLNLISKYLIYMKPSNIYTPGYATKVFKEHEAIYQAFLTKDISAGVLAMDVHMTGSIDRKMKIL